MQWLTDLGRAPRRHLPWLVMLAVVAVHVGTTWHWAQQQTYRPPLFHNNQMSQAVYTMVLGGDSCVRRLPPESAYQVPGGEPGIGRWGLLKSCLDPRNDDGNYFASTSLFLLLSSLMPLVLGIEPTSLLAGTVLPVGLVLLLTFWIARRLTDASTATAAAVLVALLPVTIAGTRTAFPHLGLMIAPALVVAALFASDRFRRVGWVLLAAYLTALTPRWGESAGDALRSLFSVLCVVVVLGGSLLSRRTPHRKARLRGLGIYLAGTAVLLDVRWLYSQATRYVVPHVSESEPLLNTLSPMRVIGGVVGYLSHAGPVMLGWPATLILVVGITTLLASALRKAPQRPDDGGWRLHVKGIMAWSVLPLLLISVPQERQAFYLLGGIVPLVVLAVVGLRRMPRIGRFLPWACVLLVVPTLVALNSPRHLRTLLDMGGPASLRTVAPFVARVALGGSAVNGYNPSTSGSFGIDHNASLKIQFPPHGPQGEGVGGAYASALSWATSGDPRALFETMPQGTLVVVGAGGLTPFDSIGAVLQATYPNVVFRHYPLGMYDELPIPDCPRTIAWDPVCAVIDTPRESMYVLTFRDQDGAGGPPHPPSRLGSTVELLRGDQLALYRINGPPR